MCNKEYKKLWYEKKRCYINCHCGSKYLEYNKKNHLKTSKHNNFIKYSQTNKPVKNTFIKKNIITWKLP
jgi:hypothetical protein